MDTPRTDKLTGLGYNACKLIALSKELEIEGKKNRRIAVHYALECGKVQGEMIELRAERDELHRLLTNILRGDDGQDYKDARRYLDNHPISKQALNGTFEP